MKAYRLYSVLSRVAHVMCVALVCAALCFVVSCLKRFVSLLGCSSSWGFFMLPPIVCGILIVAIGLPLSVLNGCRKPYALAQPPTFRQWLVAGFFGVPGLALLAFVAWGAVVVVDSVVLSGSFEKKGLTYEEATQNRRIKRFAIKRMIPPQATEINISGDSAAILPFEGVHFNCLVSELDFRAFAAEHGYVLSTNIFRNANTAIVDDERYSAEMDLSQIEGWLNSGVDVSRMTHYLGYWYGYSNYGGLILLYDLNTGLLYGSYSTN